jgi:hypothetical protein
MRKRRFRVTVTALATDGTQSTLGNVVVDAEDRQEAATMGLEKLWDPSREKNGERPTTHVERIAGEGG